ncbi:hypothetical protein [Aeromonas veronii]|uniref:hypothetical protein n=1 Tax=Aeromonas veronii TaxID=654 RepID=UPI00366EA3CE
MPLPTSGEITMDQICTEFKIPLTSDLGCDVLRKAANKPAPQDISMSDFYGKSNGYTGVLVVGSENSGRMKGYSSDGRSGYTNAIYGSLTPTSTPYGTCSHFFWGADGVYLKIPESPAYTVFNVSINSTQAVQLRNGVYEYWDDSMTQFHNSILSNNYSGLQCTLKITI